MGFGWIWGLWTFAPQRLPRVNGEAVEWISGPGANTLDDPRSQSMRFYTGPRPERDTLVERTSDELTLWWTYKKLLKMAIEIVDFPIKNGDFP
jgi:hypothetical protein